MELRSRVIALLCTASFLGLASSSPAAAADTVTATGGSLIEKGAAVVITTAFHCDAGRSASVLIRATQRTKQQQIVEGDGGVDTFCAGGDQEENFVLRVIVTPRDPAWRFQVGPAILHLALQTCGPDDCTSTVTTTEVRFTNK
jgi:hypothetical protein